VIDRAQDPDGYEQPTQNRNLKGALHGIEISRKGFRRSLTKLAYKLSNQPQVKSKCTPRKHFLKESSSKPEQAHIIQPIARKGNGGN
jgi:hypothetical protein